MSRRRVLAWGLGGLGTAVVAGTGGAQLILHGVLPGKSSLERMTGGCDVATPSLTAAPAGPSISGTFDSAARQRSVGCTIAYPPGHSPGSELPLVLALHGYGGNHTNALSDLSMGEALALRVGGAALPPMAMVAADGGGGYWHAHPGDDPMAMLVDELIPMCQKLGLGTPPQRIGAIGISMGGYGGLLAEHQRGLLAAVAAISPAVWTTYGEAHAANAGAFASSGRLRRPRHHPAHLGPVRDSALSGDRRAHRLGEGRPVPPRRRGSGPGPPGRGHGDQHRGLPDERI